MTRPRGVTPMHSFSLAHLADASLDRALESAARDASVATAWLLAHLAESDARRRYAAAGYASMTEYCVRHLRFSEEAAAKRIRVARAARQFPAILEAIAAGHLHMTAVLVLAPRLTPANAGELLAAATHRTKAEIELLLAARFPRPDLPERVEALPVGGGPGEPALERVQELSTAPLPLAGPAATETPVPRARVTQLSPQRYGYEFTGDQRFQDDLERFRALVGHEVSARGLPGLLHHALRLGIRSVERRKYGMTERPRARTGRPSADPRHVPAAIKRAVWSRDGGRCTFVSDSGHRCESRGHLEFDHELPVARGGTATVGNLRLRCRAHNQYEAERTYGAEFMKRRREAAREAVETRRKAQEAAAHEQAEARAEAHARARRHAAEEVIPWLRSLGLRQDEARAAAAHCEAIPEAPLEARVRLALRCFAKPGRSLAGGATRASA